VAGVTLSRGEKVLVGAFLASGTVHLVRPRVYEPLMPDLVPAHREVILASGVAELVCAAGLLRPASRRASGWASAALLVAVWPGNLTMALRAQRSGSGLLRAAAWARIPLQLPLIRSALRAARA
jgi:uncharacterized membrane protein